FLHSPRNNTRHHYLLRGLIRCPACGSRCVGSFINGKRRYRCGRIDPLESGSGQRCGANRVEADALERAVWDAIADALQRPALLAQQYRQQVTKATACDAAERERKELQAALAKAKAQQDRLTDAYLAQVLELAEFKAKMGQLRDQAQQVEKQLGELDRRSQQQGQQERVLALLETFCETVARGLDNLTLEERQELLRLLVEQITVQDGRVRVQGIIPLDGEDAEDVNLRTTRYGSPLRCFRKRSMDLPAWALRPFDKTFPFAKLRVEGASRLRANGAW
ncbi:MAG: hypothetical protein FJ315_06490, partial [SAR202 cluster bacterium]|nr:hypothetical protein [SAR202 cluster bacterium]